MVRNLHSEYLPKSSYAYSKEAAKFEKNPHYL